MRVKLTFGRGIDDQRGLKIRMTYLKTLLIITEFFQVSDSTQNDLFLLKTTSRNVINYKMMGTEDYSQCFCYPLKESFSLASRSPQHRFRVRRLHPHVLELVIVVTRTGIGGQCF